MLNIETRIPNGKTKALILITLEAAMKSGHTRAIVGDPKGRGFKAAADLIARSDNYAAHFTVDEVTLTIVHRNGSVIEFTRPAEVTISEQRRPAYLG